MEKVLRPAPQRKIDTFEFKFQFQASRVPNQSWDKLVVSLIPYETGRTTGRSSKGHVRNGICQWTEALIESMKITQDPLTREYEEKLYKIVVSMGSLRSGVLGETTINLTEFIGYSSPESLALPLKNCSAGAILHVKIQCLTPKTDLRVIDRQKDANTDEDGRAFLSDEDEGGSEMSGNITTGSIGSSASQHWVNQRVYASNGNSRGILAESMSPTNSLPRRQDSSGSRDSSSNRFSQLQNPRNQGAVSYPAKEWQDSFPRQSDDRVNVSTTPGWGLSHTPDNGVQGSPGGSQRGRDYARADLEAAEATIKELRADALAWERRAHKLNLEVETYKQQLAAEKRHGAEFEMEISALEAERDSLKSEVEQLKAAKLASKERESGDDFARWAAEDAKDTIKELQEELAYEKEKNLNLNLQLHKTQESNMEFVSALAELEESLQQQSLEIKRLKEQDAKGEPSILGQEHPFPVAPEDESGNHFDSIELEWEQKLISIETKLRQQRTDSDKEIHELKAENLRLKNDAEPREDTLEMRLVKLEAEWSSKLAKKEDEFQKLMTENLKLKSIPIESETEYDLRKTIETLRKDMDELEKDCKELTEENIQLFHKLNMAQRGLEQKSRSVLEFEGRIESFSVSRDNSDTASISELDASKLQSRLSELELNQDSNDDRIAEKQKLLDEQYLKVQELVKRNILLEEQIQRSTEEIIILKSSVEEMNEEHCYREKELLDAQRLAEERAASVEKESQCAVEKIEELKSSEHLKSLVARLEEEKGDVIRKTFLLEAEIGDLNTQLAGAYATKEMLEKEVDKLFVQKMELEAQLQELKSEHTRTSRKVTESDTEIAKFQEELASYRVLERNFEEKAREHDAEIRKLRQELSERAASGKRLEEELHELYIQRDSVGNKLQELSDERRLSRSRIEELELQLSLLSEEIRMLSVQRNEFEQRSSNLEIERNNLKETFQTLQKESTADRKQLEAFIVQMADLTATLDSHLSVKRNLERMILELEKTKEGLEDRVVNLEEEKLRLSERVSGLEAELLHVTEQIETYRLETETAETQVAHLLKDKQNVEMAFQGASSEYEQKVSELEQKLDDALKDAEDVCRTRHELEEAIERLREENSSLILSNRELEQKDIGLETLKSLLEKQLEDAVEKCSSSSTLIASLEDEVVRLKKEADKGEHELQSDIQLLTSLKEELELRVNKAEEVSRQLQLEKTNAVGRLQTELQQLSEKVSCTYDEKAKITSEALFEASMMRAEKIKLEGLLEQMHDKLRLAQEENDALNEKVGLKVTELNTFKRERKEMQDGLHAVNAIVEEMRVIESADKLKIQQLERRLAEDGEEKRRISEENIDANNRVTRLRIVLDETSKKLEVVEADKTSFESSLQVEFDQNARLVEETKELRRNMLFLEEEIQDKTDSLNRVEKQLNQNRAIPGPGFSLARSNREVGSSAPSEHFKGLVEMEERLKFLEEEVMTKEEELETCRKEFRDREAELLQEFREREAELCNTIEQLEMSNEQLALGQLDSGVDQLQTELIRLQNQNSALSKREHELVSKLNMQDILQREVQRLQEANEQLEARLSRLLETVQNPHILEKVITLETELAEALETNNMYKLQLSSFFEKQQNVSMSALNGLGDVDQVIKDFFELKKRSAQMEVELREMRERYMLMSLKFAEVEAEKSELIIVVKNLRSGKRP